MKRKRLWAPWRLAFIKSVHRKKKPGCIFCDLPKKGVGVKNLVLFKGKNAFIILNKYPYTNGHLLVIPNRHLNRMEDLTADEHLELGQLVAKSVSVLGKVVNADGFNVGLNLGRAAGAGIEGHLHYHVVPRWAGDSNFMPVLGDVRMMPQYLADTYKSLARYFK